MYLPENDAQMYDILSELRVYAALNGLPGLAEELDDAMQLLVTEQRRQRPAVRSAPAAQDTL
jgi:hypothetical protein